MYKIMDKPLGTIFEENIETINECQQIISEIEECDKEDDIYVPDWYVILPM